MAKKGRLRFAFRLHAIQMLLCFCCKSDQIGKAMFQLFLTKILTALKPFNKLGVVSWRRFSVVNISIRMIPFSKKLLDWVSLSLGTLVLKVSRLKSLI
jgi:hypothetical protein